MKTSIRRGTTNRRRAHARHLATAGILALGLGTARAETIGIDPYYTGSLLSPSPAAPKQGLFAFEPYVLYTTSPGTFSPRGGLSPVANEATAVQTFTLMKYGITDNLSIEALPQSSWNFSKQGFDSGSEFSDFPVELEYLVTRQDKRTGKPSVTLSAGIVFPTGKYQNLFNGFDGSGTGTYRLRVGALAQSLLFGESEHPVRIRAYASGVIPLSNASVQGFSTFGTDGQFNGTGYVGATGAVGTSVEYSVTQKLVFALDVVYGFSASNVVVGRELNGTIANSRSGPSDNLQIAPAIEYSFNDNFGLIAGCAIGVAGPEHVSGRPAADRLQLSCSTPTSRCSASVICSLGSCRRAWILPCRRRGRIQLVPEHPARKSRRRSSGDTRGRTAPPARARSAPSRHPGRPSASAGNSPSPRHTGIALRCTSAYASLAAHAFLGQREQYALRMHEAAEAIEVLLHAVGIDQQLVDYACHPRQREVERHGRVGADHTFHRRMRDVALVPKRDVLHRGYRHAAHKPREGR